MAEPEQQMHEVEYMFDPVLVNMRDNDNEELQTASKDELPSEDPNAREHADERKIGVSLFGYELALEGHSGAWNWDETLVLRATWFGAFGLAGLTLFIVLLWQFLGPVSVGWMVSSFVLALVSSWLLGAHFILSSPSKEVSTAYRLHRLFFISTNLFLFFLNIFLYFIGIVENQRDIISPLRYNIKACINSTRYRSEWTCGDINYWFESMSVNVETFVPWFLWPLFVTTVIFTGHHLKQNKMFNWFRFHLLSFCFSNIAIFSFWASSGYKTSCEDCERDGPWFLFVLIPWSVLMVIHWFARNVNLDEGVSFTFFGVTLSASKSEEEKNQ